jgi:hypothetical protein
VKHPTDEELALLAGGESGGISRFFLNRHVRQCRECMNAVTRFELLRVELRDVAEPALDWDRLSAEMRANIHLGLEAGECVRNTNPGSHWNPRMAVAFASLLLLAGAGFVMKRPAAVSVSAAKTSAPVLESTSSGLELRTGMTSMTLLNRHGAVADQTVNAQGEIRARYIDGDTGAVTINNVSLE